MSITHKSITTGSSTSSEWKTNLIITSGRTPFIFHRPRLPAMVQFGIEV
jgi:hypothetical protein